MSVEETPPPEASGRARPRWPRRLWKLIFIVFCFELGVFLIAFPWLDYWDNNSIAGWTPWMRGLWDNSFFRGALSGLGFVNLFISLAEVFRFRRPPPSDGPATGVRAGNHAGAGLIK